MLVECTRSFLDLETGDVRNIGERFEVGAERLSAINSTRYGQLVVEVDETPSEQPTEPQKPKRRTRRTKTEE